MHVKRLTLHQRDGKKNRWTSPQLDGKVGELQTDPTYRTALAPLRVRCCCVAGTCHHRVAQLHTTYPFPMSENPSVYARESAQ